jgi:hypothetical protein
MDCDNGSSLTNSPPIQLRAAEGVSSIERFLRALVCDAKRCDQLHQSIG